MSNRCGFFIFLVLGIVKPRAAGRRLRSFCICKHKFEAVDLIDLRCARVVVYSNDVDVGVLLFYEFHHTLAADMIRQTAERLGADDVFNSHFREFYHLGGQKPTLAHFRARADISLCQARRMREIRERFKVTVLFYNAADVAFFVADEFIRKFAQKHIKNASAAVKAIIVNIVVNTVKAEVHKPGNNGFRTLGNEEIFKVVVAERRIFDEYLADDADLDRAAFFERYRGEIGNYLFVVFLYIIISYLCARAEFSAEFFRPTVGKSLCLTFVYFVGASLVAKAQKQIAVNNGIQHTVQFGKRQFETGVIFNARQTERNNGNITVTRLFERFSEQRNVV